MKERFQFRCKTCGKLSSSTNEEVLRQKICYACRLKGVQYAEK